MSTTSEKVQNKVRIQNGSDRFQETQRCKVKIVSAEQHFIIMYLLFLSFVNIFLKYLVIVLCTYIQCVRACFELFLKLGQMNCKASSM